MKLSKDTLIEGKIIKAGTNLSIKETAESGDITWDYFYFDGLKYYIQKIDPNHFKQTRMPYEKEVRSKSFHVGEFQSIDKELYEDLVQWLHGSLDINGREYGDEYFHN